MTSSIPKRFRCVMFDQTLYTMSSILDLQIGMVVTIDGRFNEKRLERAVRLSLDAESHLGCRFIPGWQGAYWERKPDLESEAFFSIQTTSDVNRNLVDFLADPLDYLKGPQVKALLLRSATDTLCLKVCHLAADAWGVKKYADLLAAIYRELASDPVFIVRADQVR